MKQALITGVSSPIGYSVVRSLCIREQDIHISALGRSRSRWEERTHQDNELVADKVDFIEFDLNRKEDFGELANELNPLNYIVCNAGLLKRSPLRVVKEEDVDAQWQVNVKSTIMLLSSLLRKKKIAENASIVLVSSVALLRPTIGNVVYTTTKAALSGLVKSLALELAPKGIRMNAVLPGMIISEMTKDLMDDDMRTKHLTKYPLGRFGRPEDVSSLILYLLSDESSWITGTEIPIDGGYSIN